MKNQIYYITSQNIDDKNLLNNFIYPNKELNYYISEDFSPQFYIKLAYAGFISVSEKLDDKYFLLPEIQFEYAVLHFKNLHISKKVKKLLKKTDDHYFKIDCNFHMTLEKIIATHQDPWLEGEYSKTLNKIYENNGSYKNFRLLSIELYDKKTDELISGEIGYIIGKTYTSLSGFTNREKKYNNWGKLQLTLLAQYLQQNGFAFWNLGHPYMQYKLDLGAKVLSREEFLKIWCENRD